MKPTHKLLGIAVAVLKQKRVDYVVVSSKLHVSERSTAPYVVSTSQQGCRQINQIRLGPKSDLN
jgi:hypothetical protein